MSDEDRRYESSAHMVRMLIRDGLDELADAHSAAACMAQPGEAMRALSLVRTKLEEARMWLDRADAEVKR